MLFYGKGLLISLLLLGVFISGRLAVKIRYASDSECDRYSVDAVYNEKYKLITNNIFRDTIEFVSRVADLMADSLTAGMASLPDRDTSGNEEKKMFAQFRTIKSTFSGKVKKLQRNITAAWEDLVSSNFELLYDTGKYTLADYLAKVINMTDAYAEARKNLDSYFGQFITFIKSIVRDGLHGIRYAAEDSLKKDEKLSKTDKEQKEVSPEERLKEKKLEIIDMIISGFLGKVSAECVKRNLDLYKKITIKPEDRESVLDDVLFDTYLIKSRMRALIYEEMPKEKGSIDLARRSIYTYWGELAEQMYKDKLESGSQQSSKPVSSYYFYKEHWSDENEIVDTLLILMEQYP